MTATPNLPARNTQVIRDYLTRARMTNERYDWIMEALVDDDVNALTVLSALSDLKLAEFRELEH